MEEMTKVCSRCKIEKSLKDFKNNKQTKDGLQYHCKRCEKLERKLYYKKYTDKKRKDKLKVTERMPDYYIRDRLKQRGCPQELINNPEFIEVKRLIIQTKRLCKTSQI